MNEDVVFNTKLASKIDDIGSFRHNFPIFIADDNEINCLLLKAQLENCSDDITVVRDGSQVLYLLQQKKYHLILLGLQMPYSYGLELLNQIKQTDGINNNTPIIAITTYTQEHQRKKMIEAGFNDCLVRPVLVNQLDKILAKWCLLEPDNSSTCIQSLEHDIVFIEQMLKKTARNKDLALVLFDKLFKELPEQIDMLGYALTQKESALAKEITHKLHGSVSFCGFIDIQQTAKQLETDLLNDASDSSLLSFQNLKQKIESFLSSKDSILKILQKNF